MTVEFVTLFRRPQTLLLGRRVVDQIRLDRVVLVVKIRQTKYLNDIGLRARIAAREKRHRVNMSATDTHARKRYVHFSHEVVAALAHFEANIPERQKTAFVIAPPI